MGNCTNGAIYRYTWPGQPEKRICFEHAVKILKIAQALGFYLHMTPLSPQEMMEDLQCHQIVSDENRKDF